ncbi:ATP-binding protein [Flaviflexus salsibiostraticola]|uniref:ATP-binding protein n=1 Tax=Flaviflexus salsibiostraticola TaxID=1282737 RepID=A0A3Q8WSG9_9ACTO|nr:AAA family ATPase [Flaviflexus salsibiostraticola]AZN29220.1 ATP-binding protein [Flaviflexus salsibiostraticola]
MRVKRILTNNFAGLGSIDLKDLHTRHEIFVGGRNGVGKSQLLLAIALASRPEVFSTELHKYIRFAGSQMSIEVHFHLSEFEREAFTEVVREMNHPTLFSGNELRCRLKVSSVDYTEWTVEDDSGNPIPGQFMSNHIARTKLPFMEVTYLPADRMVERSPELTLSLSSLSREKTRSLGQQTIAQQIADWSQIHNFDVFSSLAALHYAGLLTSRASGEPSSYEADFKEIADAFERATGKRLHEPSLQRDGGIALEVEVPGGGRHRVNTLSAGELIALQILQFVKTHFETGSILLIDEPEQHLHPSLQVEIATAIRSEVGAGQLWMVTHSPNILGTIPGKDVLVLARSEATGSANVTFADTEESRLQMFEDIGVSPGLWVPGNFIAVVEGPTDEKWLRLLLPEQFASAFFVVAGSSASVASIANKFENTANVPIVFIRDRDRKSLRYVTEWNSSPARFMWTGYALESLFLDGKWIHQTFSHIDLDISAAEVDETLELCFEEQYDDAKRLWLQEKTVRHIESNDDHKVPIRDYFENAARVASKRLEFLTDANLHALESEFEEEWKSDRLAYIDPKRALGQFSSRCKVMRTKDLLMRAMIGALKADVVTSPSDLARLSSKLANLSG